MTSEDTTTCALCENPAQHIEDVQNEETGEIATARLCDDHLDKLRRYNRGQDVDWGVAE